MVRAEQERDLSTLLVGQASGRSQKQPALSASDRTELGACSKEHVSANLVHGFACPLHDVKRVVHDGDVPEARSRSPPFGLGTATEPSDPTIGDESFLDWLQMQLDDSGVSGERLTFELTETAAVGNLEQAQLLMSKLGARGCRFAVDDFGTGLSSLTHLKNLQFSSLKIDGSFIQDILQNERSQALVRAVAQLASAMGMETVAEYVETPQVCMRLIELQVQFGQGYAIGKPRPLTGILSPTAGLLHAS